MKPKQSYNPALPKTFTFHPAELRLLFLDNTLPEPYALRIPPVVVSQMLEWESSVTARDKFAEEMGMHISDYLMRMTVGGSVVFDVGESIKLGDELGRQFEVWRN